MAENDDDNVPPPHKKRKTLTDVKVALTGKKQLVSIVLMLFRICHLVC